MSIRLLARFGVLIFLLLTLQLQGCATSAQKSATMRAFVVQSQYDKALEEAERALAENSLGVMENMNVGLLRRLTNDFVGSNKAFEVAKKKIDDLYTSSVSQYAGASFTNDEMVSFQGDRFEQLFVHLYMASNYLDLAQVDSARVELLQSQVKMNEWGEPKDEIPFMHYFSGILFELMGEEDSAAVSYRKAVDAYKNTYYKYALDVPFQLKLDLLRVLANLGLWDEVKIYKQQFNLNDYSPAKQRDRTGLVVILGNGIVPQREQRIFQTWSPELKYNIRVAIPDYIHPPVYVSNARVRIGSKTYPMQTVSNVDKLARMALNEKIGSITTRAITRAVIKKKTEKEASQKAGPIGQIATMVVNMSSEIADTRCWNTLPQEFEFARIDLPQGDYVIAIELVNSAGYIVDIVYETVSVSKGVTSVVNTHWTSPVSRGVSTINQIPEKS